MRIEFFESTDECEKDYLSKVKPTGERLFESVEQNRDDSFSEVEIYYDAQDKPHEDLEQEMIDPSEDNVDLVESTEQRDDEYFRKLGIIEERSSEFSFYISDSLTPNLNMETPLAGMFP